MNERINEGWSSLELQIKLMYVYEIMETSNCTCMANEAKWKGVNALRMHPIFEGLLFIGGQFLFSTR